MTKQAVRAIKDSKTFYRNGFRKIIVMLIVSLVFNGLFAFGIYQKLITKKKTEYYSTSGITVPLELNVLDKPNYSSEALLKPDPIYDSEEAALNYE